MNDSMSGWARGAASLGAAMGGGAYGKSYDAAMSRGHDLQKKMVEARIKSDELRARENLDIELTEMFPDNPAAARVLGTVMRGGFGNFQQGTAGLGNLQEQSIQRDALAAATSGDMDLANAMLAVHRGQPMERSRVQGNVVIDPYAAPEDQSMPITTYGQGVLDNNAARIAGQTDAAIIRARGQAAKGPDPIKEEAKAAYYDARARGADMTGITQGDIEHALRRKGRWDAPDGEYVEFRDVEQNIDQPMDVDLAGAISSGVLTAPQRGPVAQPGPSPRQAAANEAIPDPARAMRGGPVADPRPTRAQNAAETQSVVIGGDTIGGPSIADLVLGSLPAPVRGQVEAPARPAAAAPAPRAIPQAAIEMLQRDPSLADQFDAKYGKGAAAQFLGR